MKKFYEWLKDLFISHEAQLSSKLGAFDKIKAGLITMEEKIKAKVLADEEAIKELVAAVESGKTLSAKATAVRENISKLLGD